MTVDQALLQPGEALLDVGCGTGGVTIPARPNLGERGSAAGIDPSPEMIAIARRKAQRAGLEIDFRVGVIDALPFPDQTFDVVTASLMMHHLPMHLQVKGLAEIWRVLKPGGRILIADMIKSGTTSPKRFLTTLPLHHRQAQFSADDLFRLLREVRFETIEQPGVLFLTNHRICASEKACRLLKRYPWLYSESRLWLSSARETGKSKQPNFGIEALELCDRKALQYLRRHSVSPNGTFRRELGE